jgi:hypothetical protein
MICLALICFCTTQEQEQKPATAQEIRQQVQYEHKTPQQIQQELDEAEADFQRAQKLFNPWYTGPLLTPSATMMPPGMAAIQPYLFITDNYAAFDSHRKSHKLKHKLITLNPAGGPLAQTGITPSVDFTLNMQGFVNWQDGSKAGGFGDISTILGFLINTETFYGPKLKFTIKETFPTGSYQNLNENGLGLGATGGGSFQTQFGLAIGKVLFWTTQHPVNTRLFMSYNIALPVHVRGFNAYGGGFGTNATVKPGNIFTVDGGIEYSVSQTWVFSLDIAYTAQNETTFSGNPGTTASGGIASLGKGYNDNLSLAPGVEYNMTDHSGFIGGVWFSVYGRNSLNFLSGILSFTYTFGT